VEKSHAWFDGGVFGKYVRGTRSSRVRRDVCRRPEITAESVFYAYLFISSSGVIKPRPLGVVDDFKDQLE